MLPIGSMAPLVPPVGEGRCGPPFRGKSSAVEVASPPMADEDVPSAAPEPKGKGKRGRKKTPKRKKSTKAVKRGGPPLAYPKHPILKCLRIPQAVLENNAGKECTDREAANFAGLGWSGQLGVEISSALKYGLFHRPSPGKVEPTEITRRIVRPQRPNDKIDAIREAVLKAPLISDVYKHYRGENLPDETSFLANTATESFGIPGDKVNEFISVFVEDLEAAQLLEEQSGKKRVLDITHMPPQVGGPASIATDDHLKKVSKGVAVDATDTCFVMMPFANPIGGYYATIYEPAIKKAGLTPVRADTDIFATGKIIDQIWSGLNRAKVLVAELTGRNPNVLYELGLAHALHKPVVLVSSNEADVPFDVRHVRVIYYELTDPFWGEKLIAKVAENIISAKPTRSDSVPPDVASNVLVASDAPALSSPRRAVTSTGRTARMTQGVRSSSESSWDMARPKTRQKTKRALDELSAPIVNLLRSYCEVNSKSGRGDWIRTRLR
jgi:hypothetical protein